MELSVILSVLGIIQILASLILIPTAKAIWGINIYIEKDKIVKEMMLNDIAEMKKEIKEISNEFKKDN